MFALVLSLKVACTSYRFLLTLATNLQPPLTNHSESDGPLMNNMQMMCVCFQVVHISRNDVELGGLPQYHHVHYSCRISRSHIYCDPLAEIFIVIVKLQYTRLYIEWSRYLK